MNNFDVKRGISCFEKELKELSEKYSVLSDKNIKSKLYLELKKGEQDIAKKLNIANPFYDNKKVLDTAKIELIKNKNSISSIVNDLKSYNDLKEISKINIDNAFFHKEIAKIEKLKKIKNDTDKTTKLNIVSKKNKNKNADEEILLCRKCLQNQWQKSLDEEYLKWELNELNNCRKELFRKIQNWLELLEQINNFLLSLSVEPGILFDLSEEDISLEDIDKLKQWVEFITKTKGIKKICYLLGRIRKIEKTSKQEKIKSISHIPEIVPDVNSNEEIIGVKLAKEIEHALPQELALLADEETSILFDLKYIEGRLLCFDMEGIQTNLLEVEEVKNVDILEEEKLGPMIICVDTSGSMSGAPESIAKAVTLYMATRAMNQKRNCFLINFSVGIETFDLSGKMALKEVLNFLRKSFNGGTDVEPALNYALEIMKKEDYEKADLLVISDFLISSMNCDLVDKIRDAKKNKNKFYSLAIGDMFLSKNFKDLFDSEWVYNPNNSSIDSVKHIVDKINQE